MPLRYNGHQSIYPSLVVNHMNNKWHKIYFQLCAATIITAMLPSDVLSDWPTYRADASRSGYTQDRLAAELGNQWEFKLPHPPEPAWPRDERMPFDRAPQIVAARDRVLFGSTVDGKIYGLHAQTGELTWTFATDGPVRFAPTIWKDRAFCTSDDGYLYALRLADGKLLWKKRGGLDDQMILGNERLTSKWPARGGAAVVSGTVYFAAGIWPSDGIFLYALDAETGATKWVNDSSGGIYMAQPHGGANARSGVSAQGYLVASGDKLLMPTGRAVPAAFDRNTGKFLYFHLQKYGHNGGAQTMAVGDLFFNSGIGFSASSGAKVSSILGGQIAATPNGMVRHLGSKVSAYRWVDGKTFDRRGNEQVQPTLEAIWEATGIAGGSSLIVAGDDVVCGGDDRVTIVDGSSHKARWSAELLGAAYGLTVYDGRLLVSTDQGRIYCFGQGKTHRKDQTQTLATSPYENDGPIAAAAKEILTDGNTTPGTVSILVVVMEL